MKTQVTMIDKKYTISLTPETDFEKALVGVMPKGYGTGASARGTDEGAIEILVEDTSIVWRKDQ